MRMSRRKSAVRPLPAAPLRLLVPLKKSLVNVTTLPSRSQICKHFNIQGVESKAASVKPLLKLDPVCSLACSRTRPHSLSRTRSLRRSRYAAQVHSTLVLSNWRVSLCVFVSVRERVREFVSVYIRLFACFPLPGYVLGEYARILKTAFSLCLYHFRTKLL